MQNLDLKKKERVKNRGTVWGWEPTGAEREEGDGQGGCEHD
jgi:hypothetical protein